MFTIVRPRSVGSFFISRSSERAKLRAVPSRRSTSSLVRSSIEIRCRRGGGAGGRMSSRMTRISPISEPPGDIGGWMGCEHQAAGSHLLLGCGDQQDAVDLVDL